MKQLISLSIITIALSSCGGETYTCSCKGEDGKEVVSYKIEADKKATASFECNQKGMAFGGNPEFKGVKCKVD